MVPTFIYQGQQNSNYYSFFNVLKEWKLTNKQSI